MASLEVEALEALEQLERRKRLHEKEITEECRTMNSFMLYVPLGYVSYFRRMFKLHEMRDGIKVQEDKHLFYSDFYVSGPDDIIRQLSRQVDRHIRSVNNA